MVKNPPANAGDIRHGLDLRVGKMPWRRAWQIVFLPGESQGQRSLVGYSPWGHKESDTMKRQHTALIGVKTDTLTNGTEIRV